MYSSNLLLNRRKVLFRVPACLPDGLLEILKIKPAQPPSWGWGLGLSLATLNYLEYKLVADKHSKMAEQDKEENV